MTVNLKRFPPKPNEKLINQTPSPQRDRYP